jgi:hypothetical protein
MVKTNNKEKLIENSQIYFEEIINFINDLPDELKTKEYLNKKWGTGKLRITHGIRSLRPKI